MSCQDALAQAREENEELRALVEQLTAPPLVCGIVMSRDNGRNKAVVCHSGGQLAEVEVPGNSKVGVGDAVRLNRQTLQIVGVGSNPNFGEIASVRRVISERATEIEIGGQSRIVINAAGIKPPTRGERVVLDSSGNALVLNLGREDERFSLERQPRFSWDDIGGLEEAKRQLIEAIELPHRNAEAFRFYRRRPVKGALLFGPPGCGKTLLGEAVATAISRINGSSQGKGFIYVKGPEILDRFVGEAEARIRYIFARARRHQQEHGYPAVVFVDEAEAVLRRRGSGISSDIMDTIVPMFLSEMSGLEESGAFVLLATNRPDTLDPAVIRDGRIDLKVRVPRPDRRAAEHIFRIHLKDVPFSSGTTLKELAKLGTAELFSAERALYEVATSGNSSARSVTRKLTLAYVASGAMIESIVERAKSLAIWRDISGDGKQSWRNIFSGASPKKLLGLAADNITSAVEETFQQHLALDHRDEIEEFMGDLTDKVLGVRKLRQQAN